MATILDLGDGLSTRPMFKPDSIMREHTISMFRNVPDSIKEYARTLRNDGWRFYVVNQSRGRCYGRDKVITIPIWIWGAQQNQSFRNWYFAHEIAHAYDKCVHEHGPEFMEWLKKICPKEDIHHELGYKPRNAAAAGITDPNKPVPQKSSGFDITKLEL